MVLNPPLQKFDGTAIPQALRDLRRWAPWAAEWNAKRNKYDKLPKNARRPEYGVSTASPEKWFTYAEAVAAYTHADGMLHGVGLVLTGIKGLVGIDMDNCVDNGVIAPWAAEVVKSFASYTEISPSGRGLRIFAHGAMDGADWNNHAVGIEVYGGSSPRYLTVTGRVLGGASLGVNTVSPALLAGLRGTFGHTTAATVARADLPPMPDLLDELATPGLADIELPPAARDFLSDGEHSGDRSRALHSAAVALFSAGLTPQEVLSVLHHSPHAFEVALDHRRQDTERADAFLWEHQCLKAQQKARPRALTAMDFDDLSANMEMPVDPDDDAAGGHTGVSDKGIPVSAPAGGALPLAVSGGGSVADDFEDVSGGVPPIARAKAPAKKGRFEIKSATEYSLSTKRMSWIVKGVLPKADIGAVFGESGSGKTFMVLDMVCRVALGLPWFGIPTQRTQVLYIAAEGASGMRDRVRAWCLATGHELSDLDGWLYILGDQPNMLEKEDVRELVGAARKACPAVGVVVVDTMAQVTPGANENSGEDMGRLLAHTRGIGKALGAMMLLVGHAGKDTARGLRGWSGIKAALDAEIETVRTKEFRAATVTKLKDGVGEGREYRFTLDNVLVDWDAEDGDVSSCVATHGEMFDESGARDVAAMERKEKAKAAPKAPRLNDRQAVLVDFLRTRAAGGAPLVAVVDEVVALLTADGRDGVGFTAAAVAGGKQRNRVRDEYLKSLEDRGVLRIEDGNVFFIADSVGATPAGTCDF